MKIGRGVVAVITVVGLAVSCGKSVDAQNKACATAVDALSVNLAISTSTSGIDSAIARNVTTACPSRPVWRISAKVDDIATKLGGLSGVNDPSMTGTGDVALNSALSYLCLNYGPDPASAACTGNS